MQFLRKELHRMRGNVLRESWNYEEVLCIRKRVRVGWNLSSIVHFALLTIPLDHPHAQCSAL